MTASPSSSTTSDDDGGVSTYVAPADHPRSEYPWIVAELSYGTTLKEGDKVIVTGGPLAARLKGVRCEFIRHEVNMRSGKEWLVLWGGRGSATGWQHVRPEHVRPV